MTVVTDHFDFDRGLNFPVDLAVDLSVEQALEAATRGGESSRIAVWAPDDLTAATVVAAVRNCVDAEPRVRIGEGNCPSRTGEELARSADVVVVNGDCLAEAHQLAHAAITAGAAVVWISRAPADFLHQAGHTVPDAGLLRRADLVPGSRGARVVHGQR